MTCPVEPCFFPYYLITSEFKKKNITETKMSFKGQDNKLDCSAVLSETTARTPVPDMVYDGTSWQMSRTLRLLALISVSRGVNTP